MSNDKETKTPVSEMEMKHPELKEKKQTIGEYRVGINFNPGGHPEVNAVKQLAANFIDRVNGIATRSENGEVKRLAALAMTHIEDAAMWAVKAATKEEFKQ